MTTTATTTAAAWILRKGDLVTHTDGRTGMLDRKLSPMCGDGKWRVQTTRQRTSQDFRTGALTEYTASVTETWQESEMTPSEREGRP